MTNFVHFKPHSVVELITNSSTTIYTDFTSKTIDVAKTVLEHFLEQVGETRTVDEIFTVIALFDEWIYIDQYSDDLDLNPEEYKKSLEEIKSILKNPSNPKPRWFEELHEKMLSSDQYPENFFIISNEPKFERFTELLKEFVYSPTTREVYS